MPSMPTNCLSVGRIAAQAHQGVGHREIELARQFGQFSAASGEDHATTGIDDRALGFLQNLHAFLIWPRCPLTTGLYERICTDFG